MNYPQHPFRLNLGFLYKQDVGTSRVFPFQFERLQLGPDLELTSLEGEAEFSRTQQGLIATARFKAQIDLECARCLIGYPASMEIDFTELYAFHAKQTTDSDLVLSEDGFLDLEPIVREYFLLELPINPRCKPDCKGLCPVCGDNLNDTHCDHDIDDVDPRLSILKDISLD